MHRVPRAAAILGMLFLAACGGGDNSPPIERTPPISLPPPPPGPPAAGIVGDGRLQSIVDELLAASRTPALGVVVVNFGTVAESAAAGLRSADADTEVTAGDSWHIGSLTKAMTGTLTAVLVEQGAISWDTRPGDVLTDIAGDILPEYANITVADLLSHRAGVTSDVIGVTDFNDIADSAPGTVIEKRRIWSRDLLATPAETPAGVFNYTNGGYIIVASMLESVTGDPWESLVTSLVFDALAMPDTAFGSPGTPGETDQPWGHANVNNNPIPVSPGPGSDNVIALGPAGNVNTTFDDYARFMIAHINGANGVGSVVPADAFTFLQTPPPGGDYAVGWYAAELPGGIGRSLTHDGSNTRWLARVRLLPDIDAGYLIVTNSVIPFAIDTVNTVDTLLEERLLASQ